MDAIRGTASAGAPVPLSVLDLATVGSGTTATEALRTSVAIARQAEKRGFHRYWVAEHHSMPGVASSSPAVILAHIAAHTDRIRLGSGGVMLPNHAPLSSSPNSSARSKPSPPAASTWAWAAPPAPTAPPRPRSAAATASTKAPTTSRSSSPS